MGTKTRGSIYLIGARLVSIVLQFLALPLYYKSLGAGYGIVFFMISVRTLIGIADLSIPNGSLRLLSRLFGQSDSEGWQAQRTVLGMHIAFGALGLVVALLASPFWPLPKGVPQDIDRLTLFAVTGLHFLFESIGNGLNTPFTARQNFRRVAVLSTLTSIGSVLISIPVAYLSRSPQALLIAMMAGAGLGTLLNAILAVREAPAKSFAPSLDMTVVQQVFQLSWRSHLANTLTRIAAGGDRIIIGAVFGASALTTYGIAVRVPELLLELLARVNDSILPELTRKFHEGREAFAQSVRRNVLIVATLSAVSIPVLCAFGMSLLRFWQPNLDADVASPIMALMGFYYGVEAYFGALSKVMLTAEKTLVNIPFVVFNAGTTLLLTAPMVRTFGLPGAAMMNVGIDLLQLVPLSLVTIRLSTPEIRPGPFILRVLSIFGGAGLLMGLGYALDHRLLQGVSPLGFLIGGPIWCILSVLILVKLGLGIVPEAIARKIKGIAKPAIVP